MNKIPNVDYLPTTDAIHHMVAMWLNVANTFYNIVGERINFSYADICHVIENSLDSVLLYTWHIPSKSFRALKVDVMIDPKTYKVSSTFETVECMHSTSEVMKDSVNRIMDGGFVTMYEDGKQVDPKSVHLTREDAIVITLELVNMSIIAVAALQTYNDYGLAVDLLRETDHAYTPTSSEYYPMAGTFLSTVIRYLSDASLIKISEDRLCHVSLLNYIQMCIFTEVDDKIANEWDVDLNTMKNEPIPVLYKQIVYIVNSKK